MLTGKAARRALAEFNRQQQTQAEAAQEAARLANRERNKRLALAAAKTTRRLGWRYRRQLAPLVILAGLAFLGWAATFGTTFGVLLLGVLAAAVSLFRLRGKLPRRVEWQFALACHGAGVLWLTLCAAVGLERWVTVPAILAWTAASWMWWSHHRVRTEPPTGAHPGAGAWQATAGGTRPAGTAEVVVPEPEPVAPTEVEERWRHRIAAPGKRLAESSLERDPTPVDNGTAWTISLNPGAHDTLDAIAAAAKIASALELDATRVLVEPTADAVLSKARLVVLKRSRLRAAYTWPGPSLDPATGLAPCGPYADTGMAYHQFWEPRSGAVHALTSGGTGSGKSVFLGWSVLEAAYSGRVATLLGDCKGGQSMPELIGRVHRSETTLDGVLDMLRFAVAELEARAAYFAQLRWVDGQGRERVGKSWFDPTPEWPLIQVVIDEVQQLFRVYPEAVELCERIAQEGRAPGIRLHLATQLPSIDQLGGSQTLRAQLAQGTITTFRTRERVSRGMVLPDDFPVRPDLIPARTPGGEHTKGVGYTYGFSTRPVTFRGMYPADLWGAAEAAPIIPVRWLQQETPAGASSGRVAPVAGSAPEDTESRSCAEAIVALPWDRYGEMDKQQIIAELPSTLSVAAVTKALTGLVGAGRLERVGHGRYRLVGRAGS